MSFLTAFVTVLLAELGDKTQLATLALAAGGHARWLVFLGAALALIVSSAVAVLVWQRPRDKSCPPSGFAGAPGR